MSFFVSFLKVKSSVDGTIHKKAKRITEQGMDCRKRTKDKLRKLIFHLCLKNTSDGR